MILNIKRKYRQTYKEKTVTVPILKDEYGEWEQIGVDDNGETRTVAYDYIIPDEDDGLELIQFFEKEVLYHSNTWLNREHFKLDTSTPWIIRYYGHPGNGFIRLLMREIEFYPSGYVYSDQRRTKMDTDYLAFNDQRYKDGEKAL
jgi:hypothetical protein